MLKSMLFEGEDPKEKCMSIASSIQGKIENKLPDVKKDSNRFVDLCRDIKTKDDQEVKRIIMDFIKSKFKDAKSIDEKTQIAAGDAAWIVYSLSRKAGRGKVASWIIANIVLVQYLYRKIFKKSDVTSLNSTIAKTIKNPFWFVIKSFLLGFAIVALPILLTMGVGKLAPSLGILTGAAVGVPITISIIIVWWIYGICSMLLLSTNAIRQNDDEHILSPMEGYIPIKEGEESAKGIAIGAAEKVVSIVKNKMPDLTDTNSSDFKKMIKEIEIAKEEPEVREVFKRFVKNNLKDKFEPQIQEEAVHIMTVAYNVNIKSGKSNKESALIAVSALIKFLYEKTSSNGGNTSNEMNVFIAKSAKGGFWNFMKWFLVSVVLGVIVLAAYEAYLKSVERKNRAMTRLMNVGSWLLGWLKFTIILSLICRLCLWLLGAGVLASIV